ncbi:MAG: hypothetical protein K1X29_06495 [Bdellovibrionales bacterium]|nr:hypothetical protein [Bdellovibrionales bacterium]
MENILRLLEEKNEHLNRFYALNEIELIHFVEGNFDNLEAFYNSRESILDLIRCIDRLIEHSSQSDSESSVIDENLKNKVSTLLKKKNDVVNKILAQDLQIISVLETTKSNLIKELSQIKVARRAVRAYGEKGLDKNLDEKI